MFGERYLTSFVLMELTFQRELHLNYYYNIRIKMFINTKTDYLKISRLYDLKDRFPSPVHVFFLAVLSPSPVSLRIS